MKLKTKYKTMKDNVGYSGIYLSLNVLFIFVIIFLFNFVSHGVAAVASAIWVIFLIVTLRNRISCCLPLALISGCYERPIIDLGLGILATIKLFDLVVFAAFFAYLIRSKLSRLYAPNLKFDSLTVAFFFLTLVSVISGLVNYYIHQAKHFEDARFSIYYAAKMIEYFVVFIIIYSTRHSYRQIEASIKLFLFGLLLVAIYGTLQGIGLVSNEYYTSETGSFSYIQKKWAISTLGPNHSHLGTYAAVGLLICFSLSQIKFSLLSLIAMPFLLASLFYSHSAVGTGLVMIFTVLSFLLSKGIKKLYIGGVGIVIGLALVAYFTGTIGGKEHARTAEKFAVGQNSEIVTRSFIRPVILLSEAAENNPFGLIIGFGFRAPYLNAESLPATGDNNYFSVYSDLGFIGFAIFIWLLHGIFNRLKKGIKENRGDENYALFTMCYIEFVGIIIAMLSQEILWPLHSRGNTFAILLIFTVMPLTLMTACSRQK